MITKLKFSEATLNFGSKRVLRAESSTGFYQVEIKCFVGDPPPPEYKTCPECGTFTLASGSSHIVKAPAAPFREGSNQMEVVVSDADGDSRVLKLSLGVRAPKVVATMAASKGDLLDFYQKRFGDTFKDISKSYNEARNWAVLHRYTAYGLKAIAIFGGIAIAAGIGDTASHVVGVLIACAVGLDTLLQNFNRLIAAQEATYAFYELLQRIKFEHTKQLGNMMKLRTAGNEEGAHAHLIETIDGLITLAHEKRTEIEKAWNNSDLSALRHLTVEQRKAAQE